MSGDSNSGREMNDFATLISASSPTVFTTEDGFRLLRSQVRQCHSYNAAPRASDLGRGRYCNVDDTAHDPLQPSTTLSGRYCSTFYIPDEKSHKAGFTAAFRIQRCNRDSPGGHQGGTRLTCPQGAPQRFADDPAEQGPRGRPAKAAPPG